MILLVCSYATLTLSTVENENSSLSANKNLSDSVLTVSNTVSDSQFQKMEADTISIDSVLVNTTKKVVSGKVVYYGKGFYGKKTSSGQVYDKNKMTAANLGLRVKLGTKVKVTNIHNGKSVVVVVNDNGSHNPNVLLDLSEGAFKKISSDGTLKSGRLNVKLEILI
jgi:rare lipoprotein A